MIFSIVYAFFFLFSLFKNIQGSDKYDLSQLTTGVWLSGAAYCGKENYDTMVLDGPAKGFVYKDTLYDIHTDLEGYIGVLSKTKTIYIVLRGSSSPMNWIADLEVRLVSYTTFPDCACNVHNGFYKSALGVRNETIHSVKTLIKKYPFYSIVVTGHSYGASVGQLLAMELIKEGIYPKLYNYGQPRVGDSKYAGFVNTLLTDYWRTTHNKDIVPHVPPIEGFDYLHSCREVFEDMYGNLTVCSEINCEDPQCAAQFSIRETNVEDHSYYLKHKISSCEESTV